MRGQVEGLPFRRCDNCGKRYQPQQPLKKGQKFGFHSPECKKEFHRHGGAFVKLKPFIEDEIRKRIRALSPADAPRIEAIEERLERIETALDEIRGALLNFARVKVAK